MASPALSRVLDAAAAGRATKVAELAAAAKQLDVGSLPTLRSAARERGTTIAFHGTPSDEFRTFDPQRIGSNKGDADGHGYNLATSHEFAQQYGNPLVFEVDVPARSLARADRAARSDRELSERFAAAIGEAPINHWRDDAMNMLARGTNSQAYESLIRAYGKDAISGLEGFAVAPRYEIGRKATESLSRHGINGFVYDIPDFQSRGLLLFPGTEGRVRGLGLLRGLGARR